MGENTGHQSLFAEIGTIGEQIGDVFFYGKSGKKVINL